MAQFTINTKAKYFSASGLERKNLSNGGGGTLYYSKSEAVSSVSNEGNLVAGQTLEMTYGLWLISASQTGIEIFDAVPEPGGGEGVIGPGKSVNTDLAVFEGTTGKRIKDSGVLLSSVVTISPHINTGAILQSADGTNPLEAIKNQSTPISGQVATSRLYEDSASANIFHLSSYVENTGSSPTVAVFGGSKGSHSFGGNFVAYTNGSGNAIGIEIDTGNLKASGGTAYGLLIKGINLEGGTNAGSAFEILAKENSSFANGILFDNAGGESPARSSFIRAGGGVSTARGFNFAGAVFSTAAAYFPVNSGSAAASSGIVLEAAGGFVNTGRFLLIKGIESSTMERGIYVEGNPVASTLFRADGSKAKYGINFVGCEFTEGAFHPGEGNPLVFGTSSGSKIGTATTQKIGFWNATPIVRPGAYTQTFSEASRTVPAATASAVVTTTPTLAAYGYTQAQAEAILTAINKGQEDVVALKKVVNAIIDDHQAIGFAG